MAPPLLRLDGIKLTFGGAPLLDGASLSVSAGDRIALVGRNGSGKSTLLRIAAGQIEPQDGEVFRHPAVTVRYLPQVPDAPAHHGVDKGEEQEQDQSLRRKQRHLELEHGLTSPAGLLARRVYAADEAGHTLAEGQLVAAFDPFAVYGGAV